MLKVTVKQDALQFGDGFSLTFQRTLRIPDDGKSYPLPPGLGAFADLNDRAIRQTQRCHLDRRLIPSLRHAHHDRLHTAIENAHEQTFGQRRLLGADGFRERGRTAPSSEPMPSSMGPTLRSALVLRVGPLGRVQS